MFAHPRSLPCWHGLLSVWLIFSTRTNPDNLSFRLCNLSLVAVFCCCAVARGQRWRSRAHVLAAGWLDHDETALGFGGGPRVDLQQHGPALAMVALCLSAASTTGNRGGRSKSSPPAAGHATSNHLRRQSTHPQPSIGSTGCESWAQHPRIRARARALSVTICARSIGSVGSIGFGLVRFGSVRFSSVGSAAARGAAA